MLNKKFLKGQSSVEFLAYAAFFLTIFSIAGAWFLFSHADDASRMKGAIGLEIAKAFASQADFSLSAGDGFFGVFDFERSLLGQEYNVTFRPDGFVEVSWEDRGKRTEALWPTRTRSISGIRGAGLEVDGRGNILLDEAKGYYSIENSDGRLYISQSYRNVDERFARGGAVGNEE